MTSHQVNVAAEAFVASVLSQAGYDVAMQYGTTQPDWDLLATKGNRTLKIQVKGSQEPGWALFQSYLQKGDYHGAVDIWLKKQLSEVVFFLVTYKNVEVGNTPRCYLARPREIRDHMRTTRGGLGLSGLREDYQYIKGGGKGHADKIPDTWRVSQERIDSI